MSLCNEIEEAIRQYTASIHVPEDTSDPDVSLAVRRVMRDNPDIFWFAHQYWFDQECKTISFTYQFSRERSECIRQSIEYVVEHDFDLGHVRTLNVFEQVMYVYRWLLSYCGYNVNSAYNQTIDSVFVRRNSVCTGYARAAQYLFKLLGIESRLVFGRLHGDREAGRHCWNIVFIEGVPYHLDVCLGYPFLEGILYEAGQSECLRFEDFNYNCFCVSTAEIAKTRSIEDESSLPVCEESLDVRKTESLSRLEIRKNRDYFGCLLANNGSTADIYLFPGVKFVVLKKFRESGRRFCDAEYHYMARLEGCEHVLQLYKTLSHLNHDVIAVEQAVPVVDLFCSHYYRPSLSGIMDMMCDVATGWMECHRCGVLYRDIHICNIYKSYDGRYKLGDFGNCSFVGSRSREKVGSPWFMAPETFFSGEFDERSAVYAITSVLYFVLNGFRPPFVPGTSERQALHLKMKGEKFPSPFLLGSSSIGWWAQVEFDRLFAKGCAYKPNRRFESVDSLLDAFRTLRDEARYKEDSLLPFPLLRDEVEYILKHAPWEPVGRNPFPKFAYGEEIEEAAFTALPGPADAPMKTVRPDPRAETFEPKLGFWPRLFGKGKADAVYSSVFAPAEVKRDAYMLVQLYLHLLEETEKVKSLAQESQKEARRRDYIPLQCKLKKGDRVDVLMTVYGDMLLFSEKKSVVWQGTFTKCSFACFVPEGIDCEQLNCMVYLSVNGIPVGEMTFVSSIVGTPRNLNPEILAHRYRKVFISYAHEDEATVKPFHEGLKLAGVEHFFDRQYLKAGDVFPEIIRNYIETADLFVLFWSENASVSEYVRKERAMALERAFPKVKPPKDAKLSIYPMSIQPHAELPADMKDYYHFGEL